MSNLKEQLNNNEQRCKSATGSTLSGVLPGDLGSPVVGTEYIVGRIPFDSVITGWTVFASNLEDQTLPLPINSVTVDIGYVGTPTFWAADLILGNFIPLKNTIIPMNDYAPAGAEVVITIKTPGFEAEDATIVFVPEYTQLDIKKGCYTA